MPLIAKIEEVTAFLIEKLKEEKIGEVSLKYGGYRQHLEKHSFKVTVSTEKGKIERDILVYDCLTAPRRREDLERYLEDHVNIIKEFIREGE